MNDMKISNGNPYLNTVELQGNGQNVGQVGGTGAGVGTIGKSNLTVVQDGSSSQSGTQASGVNKHILDQPYATTSEDLEGANAALASYLEGLKPTAEQEDNPADKLSVLKEKRAAVLEKQEENQPDLVIHKVMSEGSKVNMKISNTAAQINMQANNAQWRVSAELAKKTGEPTSKLGQGLNMALNVVSTALSVGADNVKGPSAEDCAGKSADEIKKMSKATDLKRNMLDVSSKLASLASTGVNMFVISKDADEQNAENHKKQAIKSFIREGGALAKSFSKGVYDSFDKTEDILNAICMADIDQLKDLRVTAS